MNSRTTGRALWAAAMGAALTITGLVFMMPAPAKACTSFLVSKGASTDGSTMITYAADSHDFYGELYHFAPGKHLPGTMVQIYDWESRKHLGEIPQVEETFQVVGNINEHQLAISETTFGGRPELVNPEGILDYGSLIYITLQRARTAREAITTMAALVEDYGYYSSGESFSIADPEEVWIMEMIGKGPGRKGAVWVARRIPDGYISAHANHSRIRRFPLRDRKDTLYSPDVISFAKEMGFYEGPDREFSFSEAYAPLDYSALRFCEARVWSMFRRVSPSLNLSTDYIRGVEGAEPLPLWIKPDRKLSVRDLMELMRDQFQDSEFDLSEGVGAGPFGLPYRWRPLTWEVDGQRYLNERATATQQTGFSFVSQSRSSLPGPIGGVLWFGVDDTASTVYVPMYAGITQAPRSYAVGTGSFNEFTWDSAFWTFNVVANWAYTRYQDIIKDIQIVQRELEGSFLARQPEVDRKAVKLYEQSPQMAREYLTEYSSTLADSTVARWGRLWQTLFMKYMDGNVRDSTGKVTHPAYPEQWRRRIAQESGDHLRMIKLASEIAAEEAGEAASLEPACRGQEEGDQ